MSSPTEAAMPKWFDEAVSAAVVVNAQRIPQHLYHRVEVRIAASDIWAEVCKHREMPTTPHQSTDAEVELAGDLWDRFSISNSHKLPVPFMRWEEFEKAITASLARTYAQGVPPTPSTEAIIRYLENEDRENDPDDLYTGRVHRVAAVRKLLGNPSTEAGGAWQPIETAPKDTSEGDFLITLRNSRGDFCWVQIVRNPRNHHGMSIASHWRKLDTEVTE
jgi:hypothetical protein